MQAVITRYSSSVLVATAVTFGLFFLMQALIASGDKKLDEDDKRRNIEMVKVEREENVQRKERVERPPEQVKPPELEMPKVTAQGPSKTVFNFDLPKGPQNVQGTGINTGDGEYLPIVKVQPQYPRRALSRGMTGWVIVEFTVTEQGTVTDPFVVENCGWIKNARNDGDCFDSPNSVFDSAAMKAAVPVLIGVDIDKAEGCCRRLQDRIDVREQRARDSNVYVRIRRATL